MYGRNHKCQAPLALRLDQGRSRDLPIRNGLHAWHFDAYLRQRCRNATVGRRFDV
jgi:hypothetical protein